jgi:hypothetical protein
MITNLSDNLIRALFSVRASGYVAGTGLLPETLDSLSKKKKSLLVPAVGSQPSEEEQNGVREAHHSTPA